MGTPKEWRHMTGAERAAERALPKSERSYRALIRGLHREAAPLTGRLTKSQRGSWGMETSIAGGRKRVVVALTASECEQRGVTPGPANY